MTKTIKNREEMFYYISQLKKENAYFVTVCNGIIDEKRFSKMKIKTTRKHKKTLFIYYYSDVLRLTYLSAVWDISNVEVYKSKKLHNSGEPR